MLLTRTCMSLNVHAEGRILFCGCCGKINKLKSSRNASEQTTTTWSAPRWDVKRKFSLWGDLNFVVPQKCCPVTWWPLVVLWRLTRAAQSFPYMLVLPAPAGFDINTSLWLTEALALGWAPGASAVHSALLLACWFTVPGGCLLIHFPSQFAHRAPRKTVLQQYICFMISWGAYEEKQGLPLTAPVPVNVRRAGQPPLVSSTGGKAEGSSVTNSMWMFHFPPI